MKRQELNTHSLKSLKLISRSLFYYTLASLLFLVSSCCLQQRKLTFNLGHPATRTYAGTEQARGWTEMRRDYQKEYVYVWYMYIPMSKSYMPCAYQRVFTKIISVRFMTFLLWPPQLPQQPQVNQQHLMQQGNDAFHIQHTTNTTFSPLSPPLIYISIIIRPLLFFLPPRRLCFSSSLPLCLQNLLAPFHLFSWLSHLLRLFPLLLQDWCI